MIITGNLINGRETLNEYVSNKKDVQYKLKYVAIFCFSNYADQKNLKIETLISFNEKIKVFLNEGVNVKYYDNLSIISFQQNVKNFNEDDNCIGIIVQFPISKKILPVIKVINPMKDIDGILEENSRFPSFATTEAVISVVQFYLNFGHNIALVGYKGRVGKNIFKNFSGLNLCCKGFDVGDDLNEIKECDIVVSAIGKPGILDNFLIKNHLVVDVGFSVKKNNTDLIISGDVSSKNYNNLRFITPVPNGIGPLSMKVLIERIRLGL